MPEICSGLYYFKLWTRAQCPIEAISTLLRNSRIVMSVEFEWDDDKAEENLALHDVTFRKASLVFFDPISIEEIDNRIDYGEDRFIWIGMSEGQLLTVVYTQRSEAIRIISARKANRNEKEDYYRESRP